MKKLTILAIISVLIGAFLFVKTLHTEPPPEIHGIYLPKPEFVMPFALTQTDGRPFTDQNLQGQWSLVFFGFTSCPDICPTTLAMLNAVIQQLKQTHPDLPNLQVVFVSVDPERDNLAQLDKYTHYFNPNFVGITGDMAQLKSLSRQLGVVFEKVGDLVEHSTSIALINPRGGIQAILTAPHEIDAIVIDLAVVMKR